MSGGRVSAWWLVPPAALFTAATLAVLLGEPPGQENAVYRGTVLVAGLVQAAVFVGYCLLAARLSRAPAREALALRRPAGRHAVRVAAAVFAALLVANIALEPLTRAGEEQGIAPTREPRGDEWLLLGLALVVFSAAAPVSEELLFRGLAFAALGRFAIPLTAALWALAHQLPVLLLPVFVAGLALGWLRARTGSVVPGIAVHAALNTAGLLVALATA
jgi:membrane protease YdiL (CAAX protease family)